MTLLDDVLSAEYRDLPPEQVEWVVEGTLGVSTEDLEDFWGSLKCVGGAVSKALPGIASGDLTGATTGAALGPWAAPWSAGRWAASRSPAGRHRARRCRRHTRRARR